MDKSQILEIIKEPLRVFLLAIIAGIVSYLTTSELSTELIAILTIILRSLDKVIHDYGKSKDDDFVAGGLTRF